MKRLRAAIYILTVAAVAVAAALLLLLRTAGEEPQGNGPPSSQGQDEGGPPGDGELGKPSLKWDKALEGDKPQGSGADPGKNGNGGSQSGAAGGDPAEPKDPDENSSSSDVPEDEEGHLPLLINAGHPLPESFAPEVVEISGSEYKFDKDAVAYLNQMIADAYGEGIVLYPISAYRSNESQTRNFNNKLAENKALGYSDEEAYAMTARYIAVPGTSEHTSGLAVDLNSLEEAFDQTETYRWLIEHCADYGFILRYPKDKEEVTGIAYEPWHYRYVGEEHAKKIMGQGICLEEYLREE